MIRTKIVATMGPACGTVEKLRQLLEAGVDVCRLNFSHGDLAGHMEMLKTVREASEPLSQPVAILGDLGGPKIRLGKVADRDGTGGMSIEVGQELTIQREPIVGHDYCVSTTYTEFVDDVQVGDRVMIEDGLLRFVCVDKNSSELRCNCTAGGILKSSKGINLPTTRVTVPSITDKDWDCIDWAIDNNLDYLALSFVRTADDLKMLRWQLQRRHSEIQIIAKIEKAEALREMEGIIEAADGLMVARGDLGVEMDLAQVPIIQKRLVKLCQRAGKPVIVATQMLQSMIEQSSPTCAEVSDVANAILDGTDAVMLSAETSVGKFPLLAVHTMAHVAEVTEQYVADTGESDGASAPRIETSAPSAALARGAWRIVNDLKAKLVLIWSQSGTTARVFSKHHFPVPIVVMSSDPRTLRRMALDYGVIPCLGSPAGDMADLIADADSRVRAQKLAEPGDRIVIVAGWSPAVPDTMNGIVIHTVGEKWTIVRPAHIPRAGSTHQSSGYIRQWRQRESCARGGVLNRMKNRLCRLSIAIAATSMAGCMSNPANPAATQPVTAMDPKSAMPDYWYDQPGVASAESPDFDMLWDACRTAARDTGFTTDLVDYRSGVMTTQPLISEQFFEPWKHDVGTFHGMVESSLSTIRRTLRFEVARPDGKATGEFHCVPKVLIERYSVVEHRITDVTEYRNIFSLTRRELQRQDENLRDPTNGLSPSYWYCVGRDTELEKQINARVIDLLSQSRARRPVSGGVTEAE